jgi:hypothetical protein
MIRGGRTREVWEGEWEMTRRELESGLFEQLGLVLKG